jgi:hypothetical protein
MIRAIAAWILCEVLLVIVGAEAISHNTIRRLSTRGHSAGRLSVDVDANPTGRPSLSPIRAMSEFDPSEGSRRVSALNVAFLVCK